MSSVRELICSAAGLRLPAAYGGQGGEGRLMLPAEVRLTCLQRELVSFAGQCLGAGM